MHPPTHQDATSTSQATRPRSHCLFKVGKFEEATAQMSHVEMWPAERSIDVGIEGGAGYELKWRHYSIKLVPGRL